DHPNQRGPPQLPRGGSFHAADGAVEAGLDPAALLLARHDRLVGQMRPQVLVDLFPKDLVEAAADSSDTDQCAVAIRCDDQARKIARAVVRGHEADDDAVIDLLALDFDPRIHAFSGEIRAVQALGDDAFEAFGADLLEVGDAVAGHAL